MADDRYSIPWAPPDIGPGVSMIMSAINANRADERSRAYLDMEQAAVKDRAERESAALARQKEQDQFNRDVAAMKAYPELSRMAARKDFAGANANPFNMHFEEQADLAPDVEGPELSPAASAARYMMNPGKAGQQAAPQLDAEQAPPDVLPRGVEGPIQTPEGQAYQDVHRRGQDDTEGLMEQATAETPPIEDMLTRAAMNANGVQQKRLYMTYKGQRTEVPDQPEAMSGIPEVDELAKNILDSGSAKTPQDALKLAMAHYEKGLAETGRSQRHTESETGKNTRASTYHLTREDILDMFTRRLAQSEKNARIGASGKAAAAGMTPVPQAVSILVGMKEQGASDQEIYDKAAELKVPEKQFVQPVQNVTRNATAADRAKLKHGALVATDEHGNVMGSWKSPLDAKLGNENIDNFHRVEARLHDLLAHIQQYGEHAKLDRDQIQKRISLGQAVVAALRPWNKLSNTAAGQQMEADIVGALGAPGHGWLWGANTEIVQHLLDEAAGQNRTRLNIYLAPGGGPQLSPALGGPRGGGSDMVTIRNKKTGETKQVTREEAQAMGAL